LRSPPEYPFAPPAARAFPARWTSQTRHVKLLLGPEPERRAMSSSRHLPGSAAEPHPSSATSRSLLERVKRDEGAAWERLVGLYAPLVYHWCRRWDLREPDVADILQEVFQAVVAHIAGFRKERAGDSFRGWLRTITQNKVLDHLRRLQREPPGMG